MRAEHASPREAPRTTCCPRVHVVEREESREERKTGMENGGEVQRENPLPQITRLGLLFIVGNFCSHREDASDRRDRRMICALDTLSNPRGRSMRRHTVCPRSSEDRNLSFFPPLYSFHSSFPLHLAKKRGRSATKIAR